MSARKPVIILTRPAALSAEFARILRAEGVTTETLISPVTKIVPLPGHIDLSAYSGAIFTSRNGVACAPRGGAIAWCVGDKTAQDALAKGWKARSASGNAEALFQRICADIKELNVPPNLLHFCGQEPRGDLAQRLTDIGIPTKEHVVYRQENLVMSPEAISVISEPKKAILPIFSPNSARRVAAQLPKDAQVEFVAISQATADVLPRASTDRIQIATAPNARSLIVALRHLI